MIINAGSPRFVYVFHSDGLFKIDVESGTHVRIGKSTWKQAQAAICHPKGPVVLHVQGVFRVNLEDGSSEKISSTGCWSDCRGVIRSGPGSALVLQSKGISSMNLETGEHVSLPEKNPWQWEDLICVTSLGPDVLGAFARCR
eukprot:gnl/TRDRNA2_/TRDRNA2_73729_c0_seq3.p1 gnl/TRDRNA2_/TRDRNA2_73729_c0~~gnl/TRDRNA2_/TRDRNA2_73729_c0_seq3.p1  ORF type:complete len:142 (+),score=13.37 gnl/TRDRNA2_/TRDRNA2_73729_c0_seq3:332-757(+)